MKLIGEGYNLELDGNSILFKCLHKKTHIKYSFPSNEVVTDDYYLERKLGKNHKKIADHFGYDLALDSNTVILEDGSVLISFYQDSILHKYDALGDLKWKCEEVCTEGHAIYDIAVEGNSVWCTYPTGNTIKRFSLDNFKEEVSIGSWKESTLSFPESISFYENALYICEMGNHRISRLKKGNYEIEEYMHFDESVWEYIRVNGKEIVSLDSGIYVI